MEKEMKKREKISEKSPIFDPKFLFLFLSSHLISRFIGTKRVRKWVYLIF